MKQFDIPEHYRSPFIAKIKQVRKANDPRKKDHSPTRISVNGLELLFARHFGFCYGVENAIEIAYKAIDENPGKRIFLLSQMIHNPAVNDDLKSYGIDFLQDTYGKQLIPFSELSKEDVVIIPAFGTTVEIEGILTEIGVNIERYNTTCPFVEKVWNRAEKLGQDSFTLIIHGKYNHEETRATFSHTVVNSPAVIVKDMKETAFLSEVILGKQSKAAFYEFFAGKYSEGFNPDLHLNKVGVINQTTMLATETQAIADFIKQTISNYNEVNSIQKEFADTRDTLCYATNDNQSATIELMDNKPDLAIVVGGYNSSNTTHLVELLEQVCPVIFIKDENEFLADHIHSFNIHTHQMEEIDYKIFDGIQRIGITSGASCPDVLVEKVLMRLMKQFQIDHEMVEQAFDKFKG